MFQKCIAVKQEKPDLQTRVSDFEWRMEEMLRNTVDSIAFLRSLSLDNQIRVAAENRIINTDPYNQTMAGIKGDEWQVPETYVMSCRKSPWGKLIFAGADLLLQRLFRTPVQEAEYKLAKEVAQQQGQFFPDDMWKHVVYENNGRVPIDIHMPPLGTVLLPHEPMFRITGPGELCAHFEPALIPQFYASLVATHMFLLNDYGASPFFLQSLRSAVNPMMDLQINHAALASGHNWTSSNASAAVFEDIRSSGTVAHRLMTFLLAKYQAEGNPDPELAAYQTIASAMPRPMFLVDTIDTLNSGVPKAIIAIRESVANGKPEEYHAIRVDSGDMLEIVPATLGTLKESGLTKVRVAIAESVTVESKKAIRERVTALGFNLSLLGFGAGGAVGWEHKSRDSASGVYKSVRAGGHPTVKLSNSGGKISLSGDPEIFRNYANPLIQSLIGQVGDSIDGYEPTMVPAVLKGRYVYAEANADRAVKERVRHQWAALTQNRRVIHTTTKELARSFVNVHAPETVRAAFEEHY